MLYYTVAQVQVIDTRIFTGHLTFECVTLFQVFNPVTLSFNPIHSHQLAVGIGHCHTFIPDFTVQPKRLDES